MFLVIVILAATLVLQPVQGGYDGAKIQWGAMETMLHVYFCTGDMSWSDHVTDKRLTFWMTTLR